VPGLDAENKKPCSQYCRALLYPYSGQKAKGEEKPEEELMGKRKSSPRLAATSFDAAGIIMANFS